MVHCALYTRDIWQACEAFGHVWAQTLNFGVQVCRWYGVQSGLHFVEHPGVFVTFCRANPLDPEASGGHIQALKDGFQALSALGANYLTGNIVAVLRVAAREKHGARAKAVSFINKVRIHTRGAHHLDAAFVGRVLKVAGTCQVRAAVRTPMAAQR
jgi:hypothetical protein